MAGLFKKNGRARRIPEKLAQYDDEYLLYCVEKDRVETVLESTLHCVLSEADRQSLLLR